MSTRSAFKLGFLSLFAATALSAVSIGLAAAEQTKKLAEDCVFSFMEDPCRHGGQAHATGPITPKPVDVQSQTNQTPKKLAEDCVFSVMEDPCRYAGAAYVNGPTQTKSVDVQSQTNQTPKKLAEDCVFSVMEDPCRQALQPQTIGLSKS